jgi:class 3 adenylate cyclase
LADEAGLPMDVIEELYANYSLPSPAPDDRAREDDARIIAGRGEAFEHLQGHRDTLIAASRFFGENLRRAAETQAHFFRARVIEPLLVAGMAPTEALDTVAPVAARFQLNADELLRLLYERHLEAYAMQETVELLERAMDAAGVDSGHAYPPAIAFLDMSGYSRLTENFGDEEAAELAASLATLVRRASHEYGGHAVKLLGDGVMFHFPTPRHAVGCGLELVRRAEEADLPPARMGIHSGPVVFRDGDYFGRTVNIAARITDFARPREVLVSAEVMAAVAEHDDRIAFESIGPIVLKGLIDPVVLYRASP